MFGELPKLFDRDFAIAYFLPSAAFVAVSYLILVRFNLSPVVFTISADSFLGDLAAFGSLSLIGGIILLLANRGLVRFLEGYWPYRLGYRLNWLELWRFRRLREERLQLDQKMEALESRNKPTDDLQNKWDRIKLLEANRFPNEERLILPTSFGNTYRAFEIYPLAMYGIDAISGWSRLLAVIPKEYRDLIDAGRARVDVWVNVACLSLLVVVEFYVSAIAAERISFSGLFSLTGDFPWIPLFSLLSFWVAYIFARKSVEQWGNWVRSAFDLYLPDLRTKLEFAPGRTKEAEFQTWSDFNIAVLTGNPEWMPEKVRNAPEQSKKIETLSAELPKLNDQERLFLLDVVLRTTPLKKALRPRILRKKIVRKIITRL